jgi:hypothetical protein
MLYPPPFFGADSGRKFAVFNRLEAWFCRKLFVLSNLEAKFLKTRNLPGAIDDAEPCAKSLERMEDKSHEDRIAITLI